METSRRHTKLIADFLGGYADGWHMAVKEFFRNELDIKYTERKKNKQSFFEWTQGPYYSFAEGHIFYDNPKGYGKWENALRTIKICCKIDSATPTLCDNKKVSLDFSVDEFRDNYSVMSLCEVLWSDALLGNRKTIDDLNKLLTREDLFERVRNRHKDVAPSQKIVALQKTYNKTKLNKDLMKLNRAILETFYEQDCPKSHDKCIVEGIVEFTIYKPDEKHTSLKSMKNYKLSQTEFVNFLKTGKLD